MKTKPRSRIRNKLSHLLNRGKRILENQTGGGFRQTGEAHLLRQWGKTFPFIHNENNPDPVVFDVGANIGAWGDLLLQHATGPFSLHSFEPVERYRGPGVLTKIAISDTNEFKTFYKREWQRTGSGESSMYERRFDKDKLGKVEIMTVPTIRLDTYIESTGIGHIDFLKIDVEGHELAVLKSLGKYLNPNFVKIIQFEYGPTYVDAGAYLLDMYELLKDYKICKMFPNHLEETPYHGDREDFQFTNYVALAKN